MSIFSPTSTIFCCGSAVPVYDSSDIKLHNDPNRDLHEAIFQSFLAFAVRRQHYADLLLVLMGIEPERNLFPERQPALEWCHENRKNNPLTAEIPYVIHVAARHDFGTTYSDRYFVCPPDLESDWVEVNQCQWFATGQPFSSKFERWDLKCMDDCTFFRMTLRPNLALRGCYPVSVKGEMSGESSAIGGSGTSEESGTRESGFGSSGSEESGSRGSYVPGVDSFE